MLAPMRPALVLASLLALPGCRRGAETTPPPAPADDHTMAGDGDTAPTAPTAGPELPPRPPGTIYRSEVERATGGGQPAYLLRQLGPEPFRPTGRFQGWVITRLFPDDPTLCAGCDLRVGDVILSVNGNTLERPELLTSLLADLGELESLTVHRLRGGEAAKLTYVIAPDPQPAAG